MDWTFLIDVLKESVVLTLIVTALMGAIEALNISTKGSMMSFLHRSHAGQIVASSFLGATPGCVGGYFTVSMYTKRMFSFGALMAMALATTGDEAFVMLASYPGTALAIFAGLFVLGIIGGFLTDARGRRYMDRDVDECDCPETDAEHVAEHNTLRHRLLHTIKHGGKIFLWTFGIMAVVGVIQQFVDLESWVGANVPLVILLAVALGCIPQSGPHMVFVTLFATGLVPLSVLLASCISQDGHAGLPLIAASRRDFLRIKAVKCVVALAVGFAVMLIFG